MIGFLSLIEVFRDKMYNFRISVFRVLSVVRDGNLWPKESKISNVLYWINGIVGVAPFNFSVQSVTTRSGWGKPKIMWSRVVLRWRSWAMEVMYVCEGLNSFFWCCSSCILRFVFYVISLIIVFRFEELKQSQHMIETRGSLSSTLLMTQLRSIGLVEQPM